MTLLPPRAPTVEGSSTAGLAAVEAAARAARGEPFWEDLLAALATVLTPRPTIGLEIWLADRTGPGANWVRCGSASWPSRFLPRHGAPQLSDPDETAVGCGPDGFALAGLTWSRTGRELPAPAGLCVVLRLDRPLSMPERYLLRTVRRSLLSGIAFRIQVDLLTGSADDPPMSRQGCQVFGRLTPRQRDVLRLVSRGWTNERIARRLSITSRTVAKHLTDIQERLGVSNRAEAAAWWGRNSIVLEDAPRSGSGRRPEPCTDCSFLAGCPEPSRAPPKAGGSAAVFRPGPCDRPAPVTPREDPPRARVPRPPSS